DCPGAMLVPLSATFTSFGESSLTLPSEPIGSAPSARVVRNTTSSCGDGPRLRTTIEIGPADARDADSRMVKSDSVTVSDGNGWVALPRDAPQVNPAIVVTMSRLHASVRGWRLTWPWGRAAAKGARR